MTLSARYPQIAAWLIVIVMVGLATLCALQGLHALAPAAPAHMEHMHGVITTFQGSDVFAMRTPGHASVVWFRVAHGSHLSLAHLRRHLGEQAPTDVYYLDQQHGLPLVWLAD
jgi:hypothetical protein